MRKPHVNKKVTIAILSLLILALVSVGVWYIGSLDIAVLNPKGIVAQKQYELLVFTLILGFIVVIPVFFMAIFIAWRYREGNTTAKYSPEFSTHKLAESIWWGIPIILILILSVVTWNSTHRLDPYKALDPDANSLTVQVVALDWKWLFIYPDHNIATVNFVQFPVDTPVHFHLTADAPMNSFWIPQLGGQIYAMPGMVTELNLSAREPGEYAGSSANISGEGFAGMKFIAKATSETEFDAWVAEVQQTPTQLTHAEYAKLAAKSKNHPVTYYSSPAPDLYATIEMKYMMPAADKKSDHHDMPNMDHSTMDHGNMHHMNGDTH